MEEVIKELIRQYELKKEYYINESFFDELDRGFCLGSSDTYETVINDLEKLLK